LTKISLYLDEHVQLALAESLRARGVDVLTTQEAGNICFSDVDQLIFAKEKKRTLFSYNKRHFAKIHYEWITLNQSHTGIILSDQLAVGIVLRRFMKLYFSLPADDMKNRLEYLSNWK